MPENLAIETDKAFVESLGPFQNEFVIERHELPTMWADLRKKVGREDEEDEEYEE